MNEWRNLYGFRLKISFLKLKEEMCLGVLRRSEVGLCMRSVVVRVRGKKQSCQGANGRD